MVLCPALSASLPRHWMAVYEMPLFTLNGGLVIFFFYLSSHNCFPVRLPEQFLWNPWKNANVPQATGGEKSHRTPLEGRKGIWNHWSKEYMKPVEERKGIWNHWKKRYIKPTVLPCPVNHVAVQWTPLHLHSFYPHVYLSLHPSGRRKKEIQKNFVSDFMTNKFEIF